MFEQLLKSQNDKTLLASAGGVQLHRSDQRYWLYTGGDAIQSVFDKRQPQTPLLRYQNVMLLAMVLLAQTPKRVLNLGLGIGAFERAFAGLDKPPAQWQAVELDEAVISVVQKHLPLPQSWPVAQTDAEDWLANDKAQYDLILCDLFVGQHHAECVNKPQFFAALYRRLTPNGVVAINLAPTSEAQMMTLLINAKRYFSSGFIGKTPPSANIILCLSQHKIADFQCYAQRAKALENIWPIHFSQIFSTTLPI